MLDPYSIMGTTCEWSILLKVLYPTFFNVLNLEISAPKALPAAPASIEEVRLGFPFISLVGSFACWIYAGFGSHKH